MLSEEKLTELFRYSFSLIDSRMTPNQQAFCRAIESAATAPLLARIAELTRELDEARKDAERYKHLRDSTLVDGAINESLYVAVEKPEWPNKWALVGADLDAAIDAAIKEQT